MRQTAKKFGISALERAFIDSYVGLDRAEVRKVVLALKNHLWRGAEQIEQVPVAPLPTAILSLDLLLGGLPSGFIQVVGMDDAYKTALLFYLACHLPDPAFVNADNKGITFIPLQDIEMLTGHPKVAEYVRTMVMHQLVNTVIVDSLPAMARYEAFMRTCLRLLPQRPEMRVIFSNQTRFSAYAHSSVPTLTDFIHSICSLILSVDKIEKTFRGMRVEYLAFQGSNKSQRFYIVYNRAGSVDNESYLFDMGVSRGVLTRVGAHVRFSDQKRTEPISEFLTGAENMKLLWRKVFAGLPFENRGEQYLGKQFSNSTT